MPLSRTIPRGQNLAFQGNLNRAVLKTCPIWTDSRPIDHRQHNLKSAAGRCYRVVSKFTASRCRLILLSGVHRMLGVGGGHPIFPNSPEYLNGKISKIPIPLDIYLKPPPFVHASYLTCPLGTMNIYGISQMPFDWKGLSSLLWYGVLF